MAANNPKQTAAQAAREQGHERGNGAYVKPSDALAASLVADPRFPELIGEMFHECSNWLSETPEVGYGQFKGVSKMMKWLEEKGKNASVEILKPPTRLPDGFTFDGTIPDLDGMDA